MNFHVIATGSSGNCYALEGKSSALILEAGVPPEKVFQQVRFSTRKIAGVVVTHEHGDHAKFVDRWVKLGFHVYMTPGTRDALRLGDCRYIVPLQMWNPFPVGAFFLRPFPAVHDAAEPAGFIIESDESGRILFATDTGRIDYSFRTGGIRHLVIEANYADSLIVDRVRREEILPAVAKRIRENHLSLDRAAAVVQEHNTAALTSVVLIHLSDGNGDPALFREKIAGIAPYANVYVADKGLLVPFNNSLK